MYPVYDLFHYSIKGTTILQRIQGVVIWYDADEGYGIVRLRHTQKNISVSSDQIHHDAHSGICGLSVGESVSLEIVNARAYNLYRL